MNIKTLAFASALAAVSTAGAAELVIAEFNIHDHPQGSEVDPTYALRFDNVFGAFNATFSAEVYNDAMLTVVQDTDTNELFVDISGTFFGGEDIGTTWDSPFDLAVDFRYGANVVATSNGWAIDGFSQLNSGTFTRLDTNETTTWFGFEDLGGLNGPVGNAFTFASDGFRIDNDDSTWVGRGWFTTNDDGTASNAPSQDWFFTATPVPAPSSMAILGLVGLASTRRRR